MDKLNTNMKNVIKLDERTKQIYLLIFKSWRSRDEALNFRTQFRLLSMVVVASCYSTSASVKEDGVMQEDHLIIVHLVSN